MKSYHCAFIQKECTNLQYYAKIRDYNMGIKTTKALIPAGVGAFFSGKFHSSKSEEFQGDGRREVLSYELSGSGFFIPQ